MACIHRIRDVVATVHMVVMAQTAQAANVTLGDRCGAQGFFYSNQLTALHVYGLSPTSRVLLTPLLFPVFHARNCYRRGRLAGALYYPSVSSLILVDMFSCFVRAVGLTSELLLGRYALEPPRYPDSLLAPHENGLFPRSALPSLWCLVTVAQCTTGKSFHGRCHSYRRSATASRTIRRA